MRLNFFVTKSDNIISSEEKGHERPKYLKVKEYTHMKKNNNKGFTLVELIVVLVILAILAAILVPTLLGYIDRARSEKDYSTAQSVRVATQAYIDELYGKGKDTVKDTDVLTTEGKAAIFKLVGTTSDNKIDGQKIDITSLTIKENQITAITVTITPDGGTAKTYKYDSTKNEWTN